MISELKRIERAIETPDLDYEMWRASRRQLVELADRGRKVVMPIHRDPHKASFVTGTGTELLYSNTTAGTAKNTFTAEALINDVAGMGPQPIIPAYFFMPSGAVSKALRVVARGIYSSTASPTWQTFCRLGGAASVAGPNIGSTGAVVGGATQTNLLWEYEMEAQLTIAGGTGANSTIRGLGLFTVGLTTITCAQGQILGGGASPGTVATVDISIVNYVNFSAACGTSSASNSIQILQLLVFGLN